MSNQRTPSDDDLIRLAQKGNLDAFTELYDRYLPAVYNRIRYVVPKSDVEDVTQEVFITLMKSLYSFKGNALFSTWLRTLTNRRVADYYRKRNPADATVGTDISETNPSIAPGLQIPTHTAQSDNEIVLRQAIRELPNHYQEIILMRFAEDLKFQEIADLQGATLDAVKYMFRRAIAALRSQIGEVDG
jgi:RNA polymerase sigma-70 factor (ECF subfamily)